MEFGERIRPGVQKNTGNANQPQHGPRIAQASWKACAKAGHILPTLLQAQVKENMKSETRVISLPICLVLTVFMSVRFEAAALAQQESTPTEAQSTPAQTQDDSSGQQDPGNQSGTGSTTVRTKISGPPSGTSASTSTTYVFPSNGEINRYWLKSTIGPKAFVGSAITASWHQWVADSPKEWTKDATGWGQRYGSAFLENAINTSTLVLLSRAMGQDPRYRRCDCTGAWPRISHAVKLSFMAYNRNGNLTFSPARIVETFAGPLVTRNTIYPDRYNSGDAFTAYYLAGTVGWNLFREFFSKRW
jgi:hypothetical protein